MALKITLELHRVEVTYFADGTGSARAIYKKGDQEIPQEIPLPQVDELLQEILEANARSTYPKADPQPAPKTEAISFDDVEVPEPSEEEPAGTFVGEGDDQHYVPAPTPPAKVKPSQLPMGQPVPLSKVDTLALRGRAPPVRRLVSKDDAGNPVQEDANRILDLPSGDSLESI